MCDGEKFIIYRIFLLILLYDQIFSSQTFCIISNKLQNFAILNLNSKDVVIHEDLLRLCPSNVTKLKIVEYEKAESRSVSNSFFRSLILPRLEEVQISVVHLEFLHTNFSTNHTSKLKSLILSNCSIEYLPFFGAFYGLSNLESLDLSNNKLTQLPSDLSNYCLGLSYVNVSGNLFTILPYINGLSVRVSLFDNPIKCSCSNSWLHSVQPNLIFEPTPCNRWPKPCRPILDTFLYADQLLAKAKNNSVHVLTGQSTKMFCHVNSSLPYAILWVSPIGVFPHLASVSFMQTFNISYNVQPLLDPTTLQMTQINSSFSKIDITNVRGHLSGEWYCISLSSGISKRSSSVILSVHSSVYYSHVYYISLCYGFGGMLSLLLMGIIGGTIRYCSETNCLRRPQPPFAYKGRTFIGVIPVPKVDDDENSNKFGSIQEVADNDLALFGRCTVCSRPRTHWFCPSCSTVHYVEAIQKLEDARLMIAAGDVPLGELTPDGEIRVIDPHEHSAVSGSQDVNNRNVLDFDAVEIHQPLMSKPKNNTERKEEGNMQSNHCDSLNSSIRVVRSGGCLLRVRLDSLVDQTAPESIHNILSPINYSLCPYCLPRPGSADVKLVVSSTKLAEEYSEALADLAEAVKNPDPTHFRERLEEFRNRLRRDVGHGVKVLRGEFQGLREKSAKSVANFRSQSSAAAQRMRAGFSHGVEQMKDGMRSMAELCGASGTVGQTISVVSVYIDENDQTRKEILISDFVF